MSDEWKISHTIHPATIGAAIAVLIQVVAVVWFAARIEATVEQLAIDLSRHVALPRHQAQEETNSTMQNRLTRLEVVVENQTEVMREQSRILNDIRDILATGRAGP